MRRSNDCWDSARPWSPTAGTPTARAGPFSPTPKATSNPSCAASPAARRDVDRRRPRRSADEGRLWTGRSILGRRSHRSAAGVERRCDGDPPDRRPAAIALAAARVRERVAAVSAHPCESTPDSRDYGLTPPHVLSVGHIPLLNRFGPGAPLPARRRELSFHILGDWRFRGIGVYMKRTAMATASKPSHLRLFGGERHFFSACPRNSSSPWARGGHRSAQAEPGDTLARRFGQRTAVVSGAPGPRPSSPRHWPSCSEPTSGGHPPWPFTTYGQPLVTCRPPDLLAPGTLGVHLYHSTEEPYLKNQVTADADPVSDARDPDGPWRCITRSAPWEWASARPAAAQEKIK